MKVTLTESQVNRLIKGYKNLNEQDQGGFNQRTVNTSINLGATFDSGKYKLTPSILSNLKEKVRPLVGFLKKNPSSDVKITIVAGESQVTNYDREKCANGIYTAECRLKPKQLSLLRAEQIKNQLSKLFGELKTNGLISKLPPEPTIETVLGSTKYVSGVDDPDDPKYKEEQKIELLIDAEESYECLVGMKITVSYEGPKGHECDEAIFDIQLNNQSLGVANLNNGFRDVQSMEKLEEDSKRRVKVAVSRWNTSNPKDKIAYDESTIVDKALRQKMYRLYRFKQEDIGKPITDITVGRFPLQKKLWSIKGRESDKKPGGIRRQVFELDQDTAKSIVTGGPIKDKLVLSLTPLVGPEGPYKGYYRDGSHSSVPTVKIVNGDGKTLYHGNPNVKMTRGSMSKKVLLRTDLCGKPLKR